MAGATLNRREVARRLTRHKITVMPINIDENAFCSRSECQPDAAGIAVQAVTCCDLSFFHRCPFCQLFPRLPTRNVEEALFLTLISCLGIMRRNSPRSYNKKDDACASSLTFN